MSVEERSTKFAHDEVESGLLKLKAAEASFAAAEKKWTFRLGLVSVLVLILPVLISYVTSIRSLQDDQSALDAKFKVIEAKLDSGEVKRRVDEQDTRIKDHDARLKSLEKK